jgi:hypothetical protein
MAATGAGPNRRWNRQLSWARDAGERDRRIDQARSIIGAELRAVRYFDIDYRSLELEEFTHGPRLVTDDYEWVAPAWRQATCDSMAWGVELDVSPGRTYSITWDPPGKVEGLGIVEEPLVPSALLPTATAAIWNIATTDRWAQHIGTTIEDVDLHYQPWDASGAWWSNWVTLTLTTGVVDLVLARAQQSGVIEPSADDVTVVFSHHDLPNWLTGA